MNYYAEMEQRIDQLTGTLRAVTAERDALRGGVSFCAKYYRAKSPFSFRGDSVADELDDVLSSADRAREQTEAQSTRPPVHTHGPEKGPGLLCREHRMPDGTLRGECMEGGEGS